MQSKASGHAAVTPSHLEEIEKPLGPLAPRLQLAAAISLVAAIITVMLALTFFSLHTMNGLRAFVAAEGLWSKEERDAQHALADYLHSGNDRYMKVFQNHVMILHGMKQTRLELQKPKPNLEIANKGLLDLGIAPRDLDDMTNLFRRFRGGEHVQEALLHWKTGDSLVAELVKFGTTIHIEKLKELKTALGSIVDDTSGTSAQGDSPKHSRGKHHSLLSSQPVPGDLDQASLMLHHIANSLDKVERRFSQALGDAAHWGMGLLTAAKIGIALFALVVLCGLILLAAKILRRAYALNESLRMLAWKRVGREKVNESLQGDQSLNDMCRKVLCHVADYVGAPVGAFHALQHNGEYRCVAGYGLRESDMNRRFTLGKGLAGQAAVNATLMTVENIPDDYLTIDSSLGTTSPRHLYIQPVSFETVVNGVIELALLKPLSPIELELLDEVADTIGIGLATAQARERQQVLIEETQAQSEELQSQQEELRLANEELQSRTKELEKSRLQLQTQQAELETTNSELEERTEALQQEAERTARQNAELEKARDLIQKKVHELEELSRYKSEFLANMSHELRTPLNSILLLSKLLADNKEGSLSEKQARFALTIHDSGRELISLIDEILDQARIESGRLKLAIDRINLEEMLDGLDRQVRQNIESKGLSLTVERDASLPASIMSDSKRVRQILKNVLSNAIKFTASGGITFTARQAAADTLPDSLRQRDAEFIELAVADTGIGIDSRMQKQIFEAFRQADGSIDRKYGGTGLGLAISLKLAQLLGGDITLKSQPGEGSCFTVFLPVTFSETQVEEPSAPEELPSAPTPPPLTSAPADDAPAAVEHAPAPEPAQPISTKKPAIADDRESVVPNERLVLIIEDDEAFAEALADIAHEHQFKVLVTSLGEEGLELARKYSPTAIVLDIGLPDTDGMSVMQKLKEDLSVRHIPVHVISGHERNLEALRSGAVGYLRKPVSPAAVKGIFHGFEGWFTQPTRRLLLAVKDIAEQTHITNTVAGEDILLTAAGSDEEVFKALEEHDYDCVVLDWGLPPSGGKEVLFGIRQRAGASSIPIVVLSSGELENNERVIIDRYADRHIVRNENSDARLLDETALFLHRVDNNLPEDKRSVIRLLHNTETVLEGRKVLVVDDDMRNVFALCALLESHGITVVAAADGKESLRKLDEHPDTDVVLLDIMMPEMDGYEATREIRKDARFTDLPIIVLTAKAMKGDRALCIEAGASDYMTKPVDNNKLLSILRVWLCTRPGGRCARQ